MSKIWLVTGMKPILGMRRRRRHDDLHLRLWSSEAGDAKRQTKKNGPH